MFAVVRHNADDANGFVAVSEWFFVADVDVGNDDGAVATDHVARLAAEIAGPS